LPLKLQYLGYPTQVKSCNLNQNSLCNELDNIFNYWGSFGTLQFLAISL
jgi:hypothetical protein